MTTAAARLGGRIRLTRQAAILVALVLLLAAASVLPLRQYLAQRREVRDLGRTVAVLTEERAQLQRQVNRLRDPDTLERLARECLGMVRPGEIAFTVVPDSGPPPEARC